jgi:hypothetical protein
MHAQNSTHHTALNTARCAHGVTTYCLALVAGYENPKQIKRHFEICVIRTCAECKTTSQQMPLADFVEQAKSGIIPGTVRVLWEFRDFSRFLFLSLQFKLNEREQHGI